MRSKKFRSTLITFGIVIAAFIACQVMISTGAMTRSLKGQLVPICAYVVMAVSLNLTVGISGELSLGHAGFMSVGAFSGIVMAMWLSKGMGVANETLCLLLAILTGGAAPVSRAWSSVFRCCACAATIWRSSRWRSVKSSATSSTACIFRWTASACISPSTTRTWRASCW